MPAIQHNPRHLHAEDGPPITQRTSGLERIAPSVAMQSAVVFAFSSLLSARSSQPLYAPTISQVEVFEDVLAVATGHQRTAREAPTIQRPTCSSKHLGLCRWLLDTTPGPRLYWQGAEGLGRSVWPSPFASLNAGGGRHPSTRLIHRRSASPPPARPRSRRRRALARCSG